MRNKSKDNGKYIVEPFTHQDMSLVLAYNRIRKFEIKKAKDLKHGVVINVRETLALNNMLIEIVRLDAKAVKTGGSYRCMKFARASSVFPASETIVDHFNRSCIYAVHGIGQTLHKRGADKKVKSSRYALGGIYVDTLLRNGNRVFKYNTKVRQFFELLQEYPRFQQHCILANVPYTHGEYNKFVTKMIEDEYIDKLYKEMATLPL